MQYAICPPIELSRLHKQQSTLAVLKSSVGATDRRNCENRQAQTVLTASAWDQPVQRTLRKFHLTIESTDREIRIARAQY